MLKKNALEILEKFCNDLYKADDLEHHNMPNHLLEKRDDLDILLSHLENGYALMESEIQFLNELRIDVRNEITLCCAIKTILD